MFGPLVVMILWVDILDPMMLRGFVQERIRPCHQTPAVFPALKDLAVEALILSTPGPAPDSMGFGIDAVRCSPVSLTRPPNRCAALAIACWRIDVESTVFCEEVLLAYATYRYACCWNRWVSFNDNLEWAVYEALIGSSEGPPTVDFGIRIRRVCCHRSVHR